MKEIILLLAPFILAILSLYPESEEPVLYLHMNHLLCVYAAKLVVQPNHLSHGVVFKSPLPCNRFKLNVTASRPIEVFFCQVLQ